MPKTSWFIHILQILVPFFNVRIKINFYCRADQHKYKISEAAAMYCALLFSQVAMELVSFSEGCRVTSSIHFTIRPAFSLPLVLEGLQLKSASMDPLPHINLLSTGSQSDYSNPHIFNWLKDPLLPSHQCLKKTFKLIATETISAWSGVVIFVSYYYGLTTLLPKLFQLQWFLGNYLCSQRSSHQQTS